jgi:uncharacterized protein
MNLLNKSIIAMVHVGALPGTPRNKFPIDWLVQLALEESRIYFEEGTDAVMVENMHDRPYLNRSAGPEIVASLARICTEIRKSTDKPLGLQVLAGANKEALAIALACGFDFIRAEGFVFGHLADEGYMDSDAGELLRYRKKIGAENIKIFTDIKKKHSAHMVTGDVSLAETAKAAEFFLSDGLIVTGTATGIAAKIEDVAAVKQNSSLPVLVGSGIDAGNIGLFWDYADAFIVGSSLKISGCWENTVDRNRVRIFMEQVNKLKAKK